MTKYFCDVKETNVAKPSASEQATSKGYQEGILPRTHTRESTF